MGAWILANSALASRPWVIIDFKGERLFRDIGRHYVTPLEPSSAPPSRPGLYLLHPRLDQAGGVEDFLWRCWDRSRAQLARGKPRGIGIFCDEGLMMPNGKMGALDTIFVQGRSLRMPRIILVQRPVQVSRFAFSEANYYCLMDLSDRRDLKTIAEFIPERYVYEEREPYHALWYEPAHRQAMILTPCPSDDHIISTFRSRAPVPWWRG